MLAFDVSGSMAATDLTPTRMDAAKAAALAFVAAPAAGRADRRRRVQRRGLHDPGADQRPGSRARGAIERLAPERGTSLGQGILPSLDAILEADEQPPSTDYYTNRSPAPTPQPTPVPPGTHAPAIIVLLSDGENTERPRPARRRPQAAADRGRPHRHGGHRQRRPGTTLEVDGFRVHTQLDEAALKAIAARTDGTYYAAADQGDLAKIYGDLGTPSRRPDRAVRADRRSSRAPGSSCSSSAAPRSLAGRCRDAPASRAGWPLMTSCGPACWRSSSSCRSWSALVWASRRPKPAVRFSSLSLVRDAAPRSSRIRRHLPFALFLIGLGSLVIAMARPVGGRVGARRADDRDARDGRVAEHVLDGHPAQSAHRGRGGRLVVRPAAERDDADRHRGVRRLRRDRPGADDRPGGPARRHPVPRDRAPDRDRQRDPRVDRRDRRDRPVASRRRPERPTRSTRRRRAAGRPARRLRAGDHRAADRWLEQCRPGPGRGGEAGRRPRDPHLHDRVRDDRSGRRRDAVPAAVHRQRAGRSGRRLRRRRRFGGGGVRRRRRRLPARHRRGHAQRRSPTRPAASTTRPRAPTSSPRSSTRSPPT